MGFCAYTPAYPARFKGNQNDVTVLNYELSGWNIHDLQIGPAGYLTQTSLNDTFEIKTENTDGIPTLNYIINTYQQIQPLVQEL